MLRRISCAKWSHTCLDKHKTNCYASFSNATNLPREANVVVVGGGIIGTSVAYHLAKIGVPDVILLERDQLTSGTTWHAAGLINTFGSMSQTSTYMRKYSKKLYSEILPRETGMETGFMDIGFIELACNEERLEYYRRIAALNRLWGVDVKEITPEQIREMVPIIKTSDVLAGFYVKTDGRVNPYDVTMCLAKGAKLNGAKIYENITVSGIMKDNEYHGYHEKHRETKKGIIPQVTGIKVEDMNGHEHNIKANIVVNCAGMWARQFGELCGVNIPNQAAEHYYLITESLNKSRENKHISFDPNWPVVEDASKCLYVRPEGDGLMLGLFEWTGASWNENGIPNDFSFGEISPNWDRMGPYLEDAMERVPSSLNVGAKKFFCGPESFTPDNGPIVGEAPELKNYFVAAGLNSIGILTGGGIGKILAQWIYDGKAPNDVDVTGLNIDRFHKNQSNVRYRADRVCESLGNTYRIHYPDHQPKTCRNIKRSPLHVALSEKNAYFKNVSGWESPFWYAPLRNCVKEGFGKLDYFPYWEKEHMGCRQDVALFDMSFMSKFLVQGRDAGKLLNYLSTADVDDKVNQITYTQWLNNDGYMEADLTVTKLEDDKFMVVATDTMHRHVLTHMQKHIHTDMHVFVNDVTGTFAQINIQGPNSRSLLQQLTSISLDNKNFPFRTALDIDLGYARALCSRITYVGELGYELFIPVEYASYVYELITDIGDEFGLVHAGLKALSSLRLEKAYRDYGHDMDNTDTLLECGLGFTCDFEKKGGFIGMDRVLSQKEDAKIRGGLCKRMVQVLVNDETKVLHHGEILCRNGDPLCDIRAGSFGHSLGGGVGLAMLESITPNEPITRSYIREAEWHLDIAGELFPCTVSLQPLYDPKNVRVKS